MQLLLNLGATHMPSMHLTGWHLASHTAAAGKWGSNNTCADCVRGYYCEGGTYTGPGTPVMAQCPYNMTTAGRRSTSIRACGKHTCSHAHMHAHES